MRSVTHARDECAASSLEGGTGTSATAGIGNLVLACPLESRQLGRHGVQGIGAATLRDQWIVECAGGRIGDAVSFTPGESRLVCLAVTHTGVTEERAGFVGLTVGQVGGQADARARMCRLGTSRREDEQQEQAVAHGSGG